MKGRIYERRCDLSPDGRYFIYFAFNGKWESETRGSWTAISRAPYLKAIGLWGNGSAWNGGGLFLTNTQYWVNGLPYHDALRPTQQLTPVDVYPGIEPGMGECLGVYFPRLLRDGWTRRATREERNPIRRVVEFEKPISNRWALRKFAVATRDHPIGKGCYFDEHGLVDTATGEMSAARDWEWADVIRGRLLWSRRGAIFTGRLTSKGLTRERMLKDFNAMHFEPIAAPY